VKEHHDHRVVVGGRCECGRTFEIHGVVPCTPTRQVTDVDYRPERPYPSFCCQECGEIIGWVGRFFQLIKVFDLIGLPLHRCRSDRVR
jgi:hypothetical protein